MKEGKQEGFFCSGHAAIIGRPNVGKSTFLNAVLGEKVSIVTSKPQTTRNRIIGIKSLPEAQIIFIDTPGIHRPKHKLGSLMVRRAKDALRDVDIILFMVEPHPPARDELNIIGLLKGMKAASSQSQGLEAPPVFLLINKIDTVKKPKLLPVMEEYSRLYPFDEIAPVSALKGDGIDIVLKKVIERLPEGPRYYPDDIVTDQLERFMVSEIIREKVMETTEEEVPHSVAVEIIDWSEGGGAGTEAGPEPRAGKGIIRISANIYVEKEGQKGIIIGKKGMRLKDIGTAARLDMERLLDARVHLELWVKVKSQWRSDDALLTELGLK